MRELKIIENGIVPVYTTDTGEKVVDGRELWTALESRQDFSTWAKSRLNECDAIENSDFTCLHKKMEANNATKIDYIIKLPIAKEMAMLERNEKGKQIRKYFISVEEKYNQQQFELARLSPQMQLLVQMTNSMALQELKQAELEQRLSLTQQQTEEVKQTLVAVKNTIIQRDDDWRKAINKMFNDAVQASGAMDFQAFRQQTYSVLEERARCDLSARLRNMRRRLATEGATKTKISGTTKVDVIEADPKLKEIYTAVIKEFSIRYAS